MKVFLSHSTKDKDFVKKLAITLDANGFAPWLCELDIEPSANFVAEISRGLEESDLTLLVWSPDAANSVWTQAEWTAILKQEIEQSRINIDSNQKNLVGIKSSLKPTLQAFAELTNNGLTGDLTALGALQPSVSYLAGGYSNLLAQIFRRNYPNYSAGFSLNIPLRNRAAQADYATSLVELRQNELNLRKNENQVRVDVQNAVIGLEQARARYVAATKALDLQQQTLHADQRKYALGAGTSFQVVQDQRDLASAQSSEVQAMANYTHARIALEQALGTTLEVYNVSVSEALQGRVSRPSSLPADLPKGANQ